MEPVVSRKRCLSAALVVALATSSSLLADAFLQIRDAEVHGGSQEFPLPVLLDNEDSVYGFQLSILSDSRLLSIDAVSIDFGVADAAEFSDGRIRDDGSAVSWGVVLDLSAPFDPGSFIPRGEGQEVARLLVSTESVDEATVVGVFFRDQEADPEEGTPAAINKVVREEGIAIDLLTSDAEITILPAPEEVFIRGNANQDNQFDLSDGVYTLNFLFTGGPDPQCFDAADTTDDGVVDLSDAVYSFNSLFLGGPPPEPPYPNPGPDPTDDPLDCATPQVP